MQKSSILTVSLVVSALICTLLSATPVMARVVKVKAVYDAADTKEFIDLAKATIEAIDAGKEKEMTAKITDLETAWDAKEAVLKPKEEGTWTTIDKTLDKAISAIRSSHVDLPKGKATLQKLIDMLGEATKQ